MARHNVTFSLPERELGRADIEFLVKRDGEMHGTLKVSNGSLVWVPKNKRLGHKLGWAEFAKLAEEHGEPGSK